MNADAVPARQERIVSVDALRGFDMFWIIGGGELIASLHEAMSDGVTGFVASQLKHKRWEGFSFEDLIFPLFVFIVGVSLVFSTDKSVERQGRRATFLKIVRRSVILVLLGIFTYGGISGGVKMIRLLGVLQRIGLAYLGAATLYMLLKPRGLAIAFASILIGYWALMTFVPVPDVGSGSFVEGRNLANYVDAHYLPLRKWDHDHDPEGLLSTLPAVASCLLGVLAGLLLKSDGIPRPRKVVLMVLAGAVCLGAGWLWHLQFPVIKKLWTSSFVLVAGGYSLLILALFYQIIDVWGLQRWATPFIWIGANAITVYVGAGLVSFQKISDRLVGGPVKAACGAWGSFVSLAVAMAVLLLALRFLYQRRIFLRV